MTTTWAVPRMLVGFVLVNGVHHSPAVVWARVFDACATRPLRPEDLFTPARVAIPFFRCLTATVLFPYHPPPGVLIALYRPFCVAIRLCMHSSENAIAVIKSNADLHMVSQCLLSWYRHVMNMQGWSYFKMDEWIRKQDGPRQRNVTENSSGRVAMEAFTRAMVCLDGLHVDPGMRISEDIAVATLRWIMDKLL